MSYTYTFKSSTPIVPVRVPEPTLTFELAPIGTKKQDPIGTPAPAPKLGDKSKM